MRGDEGASRVLEAGCASGEPRTPLTSFTILGERSGRGVIRICVGARTYMAMLSILNPCMHGALRRPLHGVYGPSVQQMFTCYLTSPWGVVMTKCLKPRLDIPALSLYPTKAALRSTSACIGGDASTHSRAVKKKGPGSRRARMPQGF